MQSQEPNPILQLIEAFGTLPGVGEKTATRYVFSLLGQPRSVVERLGGLIANIHALIHECEDCLNYCSGKKCSVCEDPKRDGGVICVVARPSDVIAAEKSRAFKGKYFVLHTLLSPLDGLGPDKVRKQELLRMIRMHQTKEVILATPLSVDGEATALYLSDVLKREGVNVSRIASGLPHGGELDYADQLTVARALEGRRSL